MATLRVGILRGGPSSEYNVSLSSGARVLKHLSRDKYQPVDVLVTKDGTWHLNGLPVYPEIVAGEVSEVVPAKGNLYVFLRLNSTAPTLSFNYIMVEAINLEEYLMAESANFPVWILAKF